MEKYALIGGDIHKLVRIKDDEDLSQYVWSIHSHSNYYYVPVKDESKHGFKPKTDEYRMKKIPNNYELFW